MFEVGRWNTAQDSSVSAFASPVLGTCVAKEVWLGLVNEAILASLSNSKPRRCIQPLILWYAQKKFNQIKRNDEMMLEL